MAAKKEPFMEPYVKDILSHVSTEASQALLDYADDVAFKWSRYIFTRRKGRQQYGFCTHCNKEFMTYGLKHHNNATCPHCSSRCIVQASGISRTKKVDETYFVFYEKSKKDPNVIVAVGVHAVRDYRSNYYAIKTQFMIRAVYVFEMGKPRMMKRYAYFSQIRNEAYVGEWEKCKSVYSMMNVDTVANIHSSYSRKSIQKVVKNTPYRYSCWEKYDHEDMTKYFALYSMYPCVEYLTKLDFVGLVKAKLDNERTYNAINWRGKNLFKVLKLTKKEINEIKAKKIYVTFPLLRVLQLSKKDGSNFTVEEARDISYGFPNYHLSDMEKLLSYGSIRKVTSYLEKQHEKYPKQLTTQTYALTTWRDYIEDCKKLQMNLTDEKVLYPRNLHKAHQNTIKQIKIKQDEELNQKVRARAKALAKYRFEYSGLIIRPAIDSKELIAEGMALSHCVGTYADRYARGETIILFVRKATEPNKPYFTVEIRQNSITQCRGKNNCNPDKDVKELIQVFTEQKLEQKRGKNRTRIAVPA